MTWKHNYYEDVYLEMILAVRANPVAMGAIGLRSGASIVVWM